MFCVPRSTPAPGNPAEPTPRVNHLIYYTPVTLQAVFYLHEQSNGL
jgi:hypothetical protein